MYKMFLTLIAIALLASCKTGKELAYFQDLDKEAKKVDVRVAAYEPLRLQSDDQVQVVISSISPQAQQLFNLMGSAVVSNTGLTQNMQSVYIISPSGNITIPVIGDVKVAGLTTDEAKVEIKKIVNEYLKDAVISVTLINFRITVMGEVLRPSTFQIAGEKIDLLQAIGMAGDLTIYAKRKNIKVIRKGNDKMEVGTLDLNDSKVMRSPFYNLRQNDIVLVESDKKKGLQAENLNIIIPAATSIISLIIVALTRIR